METGVTIDLERIEVVDDQVAAILNRLGIPYLVTGSVGAMAYGEPRLTNDTESVRMSTITAVAQIRQYLAARSG